MNMYISPLERMILESIQMQQKTIANICFDTNIQPAILQNIIQSLIVKGLILLNDEGIYSINKNLSESSKASLRNKENVILECNEIVRASIKISIDEDSKNFHLKKVALNESQKKLLKAMLYNINSFLEDCHQENKNIKTKDQTVIFWGENTYENLTQNIIKTI